MPPAGSDVFPVWPLSLRQAFCPQGGSVSSCSEMRLNLQQRAQTLGPVPALSLPGRLKATLHPAAGSVQLFLTLGK